MLCGCRQRVAVQEETHILTPEEKAAHWADSVVGTMTAEEMAGQLLIPAVYSRMEAPDSAMLRLYADSLHVGGVLLLQGYAESAAEVADLLRAESNIGPWIAIDAEWGLGMRLADAPRFPRNSHLSSDGDIQLMIDYGEEMARECRVLGINIVLGPVADVSKKGSLMASRSFGDDPQAVADLMVAYSLGLESGGVVSVAKHFPGHGRDIGDSHHLTPEITIDRDSLEQTDLYPFRRYADAGLSGIMAGHIRVLALDSTGRPASVSRAMLTDLVREDMGFRGLILTDALNMDGANGWSATDAIEAGADLVLAPASTCKEIENIIERMRSSKAMQTRVRESCRRILVYKYLFRVAGPEQRRRAINHQRSLQEVLFFGADSLEKRLSGQQ